MEQILAIIRQLIADAGLQGQVINKITEGKFVVRTAAEEEQYKANLIATNKEDIIKEEKKIWMRRIEDDVREITGLKQNPSEPYHDFMKRGFKSLNEKIDALDIEKKKLEATAGKDGGEVWKTKYETLEQQSKEAIRVKDEAMLALQTKVATSERRAELDKVFLPIKAKFIDTLPGFFVDYEAQVISETLAKSAVIDGKLVLVDEKGNPRKDAQLNNIAVESFLTDKFKDVIKVDKTQTGGGTTPPAGTPPGAPPPPPPAGTPFNTGTIPGEVKTQGQLIDFLGKQGLLQGTKEYDEAFAKSVQEKNITKLF